MGDQWVRVQDAAVSHEWECKACGKTVSVSPDWYENNGTPVCDSCDDDMCYVQTFVNVHTSGLEEVREPYNGWTNYETWLVNAWLDASEGDQEMRREWAKESVEMARAVPDGGGPLSRMVEALKDWMGDMVAEQRLEGLMADMMGAAVASVNWDELARHYIDEVTDD